MRALGVSRIDQAVSRIDQAVSRIDQAVSASKIYPVVTRAVSRIDQAVSRISEGDSVLLWTMLVGDTGLHAVQGIIEIMLEATPTII